MQRQIRGGTGVGLLERGRVMSNNERARYSSPATTDYQLAVLAKSQLDHCFADHFSLQTFSHTLGLTPRTLRDIFNRYFGCSPSRYIIVKRVKNAQTLISKGIPVKQAAVDSGFHDQAHLTRHFKRLTGTTPAHYALQSKSSVST
jgi:AraC-like DNA-binding protein